MEETRIWMQRRGSKADNDTDSRIASVYRVVAHMLTRKDEPSASDGAKAASGEKL